MEQFVCTNCGYNMVGYYPKRCPFCNASRDQFITSEECSKRYSVKKYCVTDDITCLISVLRLGYEQQRIELLLVMNVFGLMPLHVLILR
jgi:hypothetical protein